MIKTIQIAAVVLAVCAVAALAAAVFFGIRPEAARREVLKETSIVEEFRKNAVAAPSQTKSSPLVAQAQALAKRLDPPPPPKPVEKSGGEASPSGTSGSRPAPPPPPAKFDLIATAVNPVDASQSYALLSQPGKGMFWVKPNDEVSRAVIKQILPGKIVTADGHEYTVTRTPRVNLLKPGSPLPEGYDNFSLAPTRSEKTPAAATAVVQASAGSGAAERPVPPPAPETERVSQPLTPEEAKSGIEWLKAAMENPEAIGLTKEEAAELGNLGEILKDITAEAESPGATGADPNQAPAGGGE